MLCTAQYFWKYTYRVFKNLVEKIMHSVLPPKVKIDGILEYVTNTLSIPLSIPLCDNQSGITVCIVDQGTFIYFLFFMREREGASEQGTERVGRENPTQARHCQHRALSGV